MDIDNQGDAITFSDIHRHFPSLPKSQTMLLSQVSLLLKFVLLMPATNAVSERSASAMRRLNTYLCTTMTQSRLNDIMLLYIHKELTDSISHQDILSEFAFANEDRIRHFERF
jgi:uncharacterized membrane protein